MLISRCAEDFELGTYKVVTLSPATFMSIWNWCLMSSGLPAPRVGVRLETSASVTGRACRGLAGGVL